MTPSRRELSLAAYRSLRAGLCEAAWASALRWIQWAPPVASGLPWITLGLCPDFAGLSTSCWPSKWRAPGSRESVPLRCVPASGDGAAQAWLRVSNADSDFGQGTLGGFMRARSSGSPLLALTAGHVVAGSGLAQRLDNVNFSVDEQAVAEGRLYGWAPAFDATGLDTALDAAAIHIDEATGALLQSRSAMPRGAALATPNQDLRLLTRHNGELPARAMGLLSAFMRVGNDDLLRYHLVDGLCYDVGGGSEAGDSGAAVWDANDRLVALHAGSAPEGAAGNALATPINRVLNWFGGDLVTRTGAPAAAPMQPAFALKPLPAPGAVVQPAPVPKPERSVALDILARTMWGEARGERVAGMEAVAHVVFNRRDARRWWGSTIEAVCHKPFQFSCWNEGDRNRGQLMTIDGTNAEFAAALNVAQALAAMSPTERARADTTKGATHYHVRGLTPLPNWARGKVPCEQIGRHVFYRGIA